jgi:hypothetical protein
VGEVVDGGGLRVGVGHGYFERASTAAAFSL